MFTRGFNMGNELYEKRIVVANDCFEGYNFGEGVTVAGSDSWERDGDDLLKVVYVEFDDSEEDTSEKVSFHVSFDKNSIDVNDVYGLMVRSGSEIGNMPSQPGKKKMKF